MYETLAHGARSIYNAMYGTVNYSLTLRVVAVDPTTLQPCVAITGTKLPRAKKPRAE